MSSSFPVAGILAANERYVSQEISTLHDASSVQTRPKCSLISEIY